MFKLYAKDFIRFPLAITAILTVIQKSPHLFFFIFLSVIIWRLTTDTEADIGCLIVTMLWPHTGRHDPHGDLKMDPTGGKQTNTLLSAAMLISKPLLTSFCP